MPAVRPIGGLGSVGLLLPTVPRVDFPAHTGTTTGANLGRTWGTTAWLAEVCQEAEEAGAGALWATDHLFWGRPMLECLATLAVAATTTRSLVVGSCVLQLPLRSAPAVAKQAATLQLLSGGRFVLGVGSGSHPGEYRAAGVPYAGRGRLLDRAIDELRVAWATAGDLDLGYRQEPAAAPVPVWVGGSSPAARRRAAAAGDGWIPLFVPTGELARSFEHLRRETAEAGRDPAEVTTAAVLAVAVGDDRRAHLGGTRWLSALYGIPPKAFDRHLVAGSPARCAEEVALLADAGAEHVVLMVADDHPLDHFAGIVEALGPARPATGRPTDRTRRDLTEVPA